MPIKGMSCIFCLHKSTSSPTTTSSNPLRPPSSPLYSYSKAMMDETIARAEEMISKWNPDTYSFVRVTSLFYESKLEAREFLRRVKDLQRAMNFLISQDPSSETLIRAQNLMQIAMKRLQKEFYQILTINRAHLDFESISGRSSVTSRSSVISEDGLGSEDDIQVAGNSITEVENETAIAMSYLKSIADCMISCGYGKECVNIFIIIRKSIVEEELYRLGIERVSSHRIQKMNRELVELKIKNWLNAVTIAVKTLFYGERFLCDHVFSNSDLIREFCFFEISREGAITLFQFAELVITSKKWPEKIFPLLDIYTTISNLRPEIEAIFSSESTSVVQSQVISSLIKLGEAVRTTLTEFESTIQKKEASKSPPQGGGVHILTQHVMNYLSILADYSIILPDIMTDWPLPFRTPLPESYFDPRNSDSGIDARFAWLILILLCKLDEKAKQYKDVSLSYLFLTNNLHFIISRVRRSNLQLILGEDWISKHETKVKLYAANYERVGWHNVLSVLPENPTTKISLKEANNCLKRFESAFETTYRTQLSWIVPDSKLRDEIKVSISKKLLPAYQMFYETYLPPLNNEKNLQNVIRYSTDDLGNYLSDLFYGK